MHCAADPGAGEASDGAASPQGMAASSGGGGGGGSAGGGGGGGRVPVVMPGVSSSRGHRMFKVQEAMNRAARTAAVVAASSPSPSPSSSSSSPSSLPPSSPPPSSSSSSPSSTAFSFSRSGAPAMTLQSQRPRSPRTHVLSSCNSRTGATATAAVAGLRTHRGRGRVASPPSTEEHAVAPGSRTEASLPRRHARQLSQRHGDGSRRADPPNVAGATGALAAAKDIEGEQRRKGAERGGNEGRGGRGGESPPSSRDDEVSVGSSVTLRDLSRGGGGDCRGGGGSGGGRGGSSSDAVDDVIPDLVQTTARTTASGGNDNGSGCGGGKVASGVASMASPGSPDDQPSPQQRAGRLRYREYAAGLPATTPRHVGEAMVNPEERTDPAESPAGAARVVAAAASPSGGTATVATCSAAASSAAMCNPTAYNPTAYNPTACNATAYNSTAAVAETAETVTTGVTGEEGRGNGSKDKSSALVVFGPNRPNEGGVVGAGEADDSARTAAFAVGPPAVPCAGGAEGEGGGGVTSDLSTNSPLVSAASVSAPPSGLASRSWRSRRSARESKSAWTNPTCLAKLEEPTSGCTPSR